MLRPAAVAEGHTKRCEDESSLFGRRHSSPTGNQGNGVILRLCDWRSLTSRGFARLLECSSAKLLSSPACPTVGPLGPLLLEGVPEGGPKSGEGRLDVACQQRSGLGFGGESASPARLLGGALFKRLEPVLPTGKPDTQTRPREHTLWLDTEPLSGGLRDRLAEAAECSSPPDRSQVLLSAHMVVFCEAMTASRSASVGSHRIGAEVIIGLATGFA